MQEGKIIVGETLDVNYEGSEPETKPDAQEEEEKNSGAEYANMVKSDRSDQQYLVKLWSRLWPQMSRIQLPYGQMQYQQKLRMLEWHLKSNQMGRQFPQTASLWNVIWFRSKTRLVAGGHLTNTQ